MEHLQYKSPRLNIKSAGTFAPANNTFLLVLSSVYPYKNRSPHSVIQPQFAPLYRASSPLITVPKALPWQIKSTLIIVLFLLILPGNALFCKGSRGHSMFALMPCFKRTLTLLLVLIIRIILSTYKFFPSSYAFFIIST